MRKGTSKSGNVWVRPCNDRPGQFRVYFRDDAGLHGSRRFLSEEEAERFAVDVRAELASRSRTVGEAVDAFRVDMEERQLRPETVRQTVQRLEALHGATLDLPLAALDYERCKGLYRAVATGGAYSASTHHKQLETAKTWANWVCHRDRAWLKMSPWEGVDKIGKRADNRNNALRDHEVEKWNDQALAMADGGDVGAVSALVALYCNLRPAEIVQIEARDVDRERLHVDGERLKTDNARRKVDLPEVLRPYLDALCAGKAPTDRIFPFNRDYPTDAAKRISVAAGVPVATSRMLRHTFASLLAEQGVSVARIGDSMGHGDRGRTAQRHYLAPGAVEAGAVRKVAHVLSDGRKRSPRAAVK